MRWPLNALSPRLIAVAVVILAGAFPVFAQDSACDDAFNLGWDDAGRLHHSDQHFIVGIVTGVVLPISFLDPIDATLSESPQRVALGVGVWALGHVVAIVTPVYFATPTSIVHEKCYGQGFRNRARMKNLGSGILGNLLGAASVVSLLLLLIWIGNNIPL